MPSTAVLVLAGAIGVYMLLYRILRITQDKREPPVIFTTIPFLSPILEMAKGGPDFWNDIRDKYAHPIYTLRLPRSRIYVVNSTALIQATQRQDTAISFWELIRKSASNVLGASSISNDILTTDKESPDSYFATYPKYTHPTLMPGRHLDAMNWTSLQLIAASFDRLQAKCSSGGPAVILNLYEWTTAERYLASSEAFYGPRNPLRDPAFLLVFEKFEAGIVRLLIGLFPNIIARESVRAREKLAKAFAQYFSSGGHNEPGASELIRSRFKHNSDNHIPLDDIARFEVGNTIAILSNALPSTFWLLFHIYSDPTVLDDVRREIWKGVVTNKTTTTTGQEHRKYTLDLNHIKTSCPILLSTFQEILRFHGVGVPTRIVTKDHLLDNRYLLKKGSTVLIPAQVQHSDPTIWGPTVGVFDHKRFLKQERPTTKRPNPAAFRGFGGGAQLCPGRHFASTEILAFAALMAVRFDIRPKAGGVWTPPTTKNFPKAANMPKPDYDIEVEVKLCDEVKGASHEWGIGFSGSDKPMEVSAEDMVGV